MTISRAQVDKFSLKVKTEHRITHLHRPRTTRSPMDICYSRVTERSYYSSLFLFFLEVRRKQQSIFSFGRSAWVRKPNCVRNILGPGILDLVIRIICTSNSKTFLGLRHHEWLPDQEFFSCIYQRWIQVRKRILECLVEPREWVITFFSLSSPKFSQKKLAIGERNEG